MKTTPTQFRIQKLESAYAAIEFLETMGIIFYDNEATAIDDSKTAIKNALNDAITDDYEAQA